MSDYENAPAAKLLATNCIFCRRVLIDSESVECGVGPVCRERNGYDLNLPESTRKQANILVHQISTNRNSPEVKSWVKNIRDLGLDNLADKLEGALADVVIEEKGSNLWVKTPYLESSLGSWRSIPGRVFNCEAKVNVIPTSQSTALWNLLRTHYKGLQAKGRKGLFVI